MYEKLIFGYHKIHDHNIIKTLMDVDDINVCRKNIVKKYTAWYLIKELGLIKNHKNNFHYDYFRIGFLEFIGCVVITFNMYYIIMGIDNIIQTKFPSSNKKMKFIFQ